MIKKKLKKQIFLESSESSESSESIKSENKAWDKDNQAWWDWYVSLADNSNSNIKDTLLELPEPPKIKYSSKTDLKQQLSRPYNLTINNIKTFQRNGFIKLKNFLTTSFQALGNDFFSFFYHFYIFFLQLKEVRNAELIS